MAEVSAGFLVPGEDSGRLVKACEVGSMAPERRPWKHLNPLKGKTGNKYFFACSFCDEP